MKLRVRPTGRIQRILVVATVVGVAVAFAPTSRLGRPRRRRGEPPASAQYQVLGPETFDDVNAIARTGASVDGIEHGRVQITATASEVRSRSRRSASRSTLVPSPSAAGAGGRRAQLAFPPADAGYHDYAEMVAEINALVAVQAGHRPEAEHRHLVRGPRHAADQDLRQRGDRRERAGGPVQRPPARPRAPDRRDGALPAAPAHRQLRHRHPDHQPGQQPRVLDRARHEPGRRRVRHRHRLLPVVAQEPPAQQRIVQCRHRPQPQLELPVGLLRRLVRQHRQRDLPRPVGVLGAGDPAAARLRQQPGRSAASSRSRRTSTSTRTRSWCCGRTATPPRTPRRR